MPIIPSLKLSKSHTEICMNNQTDYGDQERHKIPTYFYIFRVDGNGKRTPVVGIDYDPYLDDNVCWVVDSPGLFVMQLYIKEDCLVEEEVLFYDPCLLDKDREAFLKCKCVGCTCYKCRKKMLEGIDDYVRLKVLFDSVLYLEKNGELLIAACVLGNIMKLLEDKKRCSVC